jgi:hypothetical protein
MGSSKQKLPFNTLNSIWNNGIYHHVGIWPQSNRVRQQIGPGDEFGGGWELIPRLVDQDPWAQLRRPMDMIRQG